MLKQQVSKRLPNNFDDDCPLIDRSFVVSYDSNAGFRISVDIVINCPSKFPTFASLLLVSPLERSDSDFKVITKLDYNSGLKSFKFLDGYQVTHSILTNNSGIDGANMILTSLLQSKQFKSIQRMNLLFQTAGLSFLFSIWARIMSRQETFSSLLLKASTPNL